jgi:hypothetical protein
MTFRYLFNITAINWTPETLAHIVGNLLHKKLPDTLNLSPYTFMKSRLVH